MSGLFNDLVPKAGGMFDDLIPTIRDRFSPRGGYVGEPQGRYQLRPRYPQMPAHIFKRELEAVGVGMEEAPAKARALMSLGPDNDQTKRRALEVALGVPVWVRTGRRSGFLEYSKDGGKTWNIVNMPYADIEDIPGMAGGAMTGAGEIAGGLAGTLGFRAGPAVGVATTAVGSAGGTYLAHVQRLRLGRTLGVHDMTDNEIHAEADIQATLSGAGAVAMPAAAKIAKLIRTGYMGRMPRNALPERELERTRQTQAEMEALAGREFPATVGQAGGDQTLQDVEAALANRPGGAPLSAVYDTQKEVVEDTLTQKLGMPGADEAVRQERIGEGVQRAMGAGPTRGIANVTGQTQAVEQQARTAADAVAGVPPYSAGQQLQTVLQEGRTKIFGALSQEYRTDIDTIAPNIEVDLSPLRGAASTLQGLIKTVLPSLSQYDAGLVTEALEKGAPRTVSTGILDVAGRPITRREMPSASLSEVQVALSDLRHEIRAINRGVSPHKNIKVFEELVGALEATRNQALAKLDDDTLERVLALETKYAQAKSAIDRSLVGEIITKVEGGGYRMSADDVIPTILRDREGAEQIAKVLADPEYAGEFIGARDVIRRGLMGRYTERVTYEGIANSAKHKNFMRDHEGVLQQFFSPAEMRKFQRAGAMADELKNAVKREARAVQSLNKSLGMKMQNWDAVSVVHQLMGGSKADAVPTESLHRVMVTLRQNDPRLLDEFKTAVLARFRQDSSRYNGRTGAWEIVPDAFVQNVDRYQAALRITHGGDFVNNLQTVKRGVQVMSRVAPSGDHSLLRSMLMDDPGASYKLAQRAMIGPLTMMSRRASVVLATYQKNANAALVRALSSPKELEAYMNLRTLKPSDAAALAITGGMGAELLAE